MMRRPMLFCLFLALGLARAEDVKKVKFVRLPDFAVQPQVAVSQGKVHLIYFLGEAAAGNIYYTRSEDGGATFNRDIRVNSRRGSAIAVGNVRGEIGRAHV